MNVKSYIYILCTLLFFSACEEIIDVNLNDADPRVVIEANLSDLQSIQRIRVSKTVAFDEPINSVGVRMRLYLCSIVGEDIIIFSMKKMGIM